MANFPVHEVMSPDVTFVRPDMTLEEAAARLVEADASGAPVLDHEGRLVGMLTERDFFAVAGTKRRRGVLRAIADGFRPGRGEDGSPQPESVRDVMTRKIIWVRPWESVARAERLLGTHGVNRLPVVDGDGRLIGIVSRGDIIRHFTRADDHVLADVQALFHDPMYAPDDVVVDVRVKDGVVSLTGEVHDEADRLCIENAVAAVPGVTGVDSHLRALHAPKR